MLTTALLTVLAFRAGWRVAMMTETDVIQAFAQHYMQETGGAKSECAAAPSAVPGAWTTVQCTQLNGTERLYHVNRFGAQVFPERHMEPQS